MVREYVGTGEVAELIAIIDEEERSRREAEKQAMCAEIAESDAIDEQIGALGRLLNALVQAELQAQGFHQHKGQWRRKREQKTDS